MDEGETDNERLEKIEGRLDRLLMRQEAVITAIHKLASVIDTTNALVSEMASWTAANTKPRGC